MEYVVGTSLAAAAGLNAWIPLLVLGLLARFTEVISLPAGWAWLTSDVALWVVAGLLVVEIVADKIPALDTVNDVVHTVIRPAAGGVVFGAGASAEALKLDDPASLAQVDWVPVVVGIVVALGVHGAKAAARPAANVATAGLAAPVLSTAEDATSALVSVLAILVPVLALCFAVLAVAALVWAVARRRRRRRAATRASAP